MKALVYHGPKKVSIDNVPDSRLEKQTDVVIKLTTTNICGSELPLAEAPAAYKHFDNRDEGWTKVILHPHAA